jgi:thiamine-monophosphate kinase
LAACGAQPVAFFLALALPKADDAFLLGFSEGLYALADIHRCELLGGDTTRGPLNICITVMGEVPQGQALLRSGAQVGDDVYVSGCLGDASLALMVFKGEISANPDELHLLRQALEQPQPRTALGLALRGIAHSAIDVSDGLWSDLGHVLHRSKVGASIKASALPRSVFMREQTTATQQRCLLAGGDDYELLFTAPPHQAKAVMHAAEQAQVLVTCIGQIEAEPGLRLLNDANQLMPVSWAGFDHFR